MYMKNVKWSMNMKKIIILKLLGNMCIAIEHVGSTSVKGMVAKPIIDIAVGVHDLNILKKITCDNDKWRVPSFE